MKKLKDVKIKIVLCFDENNELDFIINLFKKHKINFKYAGDWYCDFYFYINCNKSDIINFYIDLFENDIDKKFIKKNWHKFYNKEENELQVYY